jgi:NAD(P)-dependent dehydrogenase (short-subunit alcohol dehydrogenase family)
MSTQKVAVITGAASGVGRACAVTLAAAGWNVVLTGRSEESLRTAASSVAPAERAFTFVCTVGNLEQTAWLKDFILQKFGRIDLLVNAAGTNVPKRGLEVLSLEDYHLMLDSNLNGAYYLVQAFLPKMREQKSGMVINIISEAGRQASPKSGPGYVISKFGMVGLTQAINAEERPNGIRACAILPGDIDTPLLDKRPSPPPPEARLKMLQPEDVAECVLFCASLPERAVVEELLLRPR